MLLFSLIIRKCHWRYNFTTATETHSSDDPVPLFLISALHSSIKAASTSLCERYTTYKQYIRVPISKEREWPEHCAVKSTIIIPPLQRKWNGGILDSPRCLPVRPSVRPTVCRQGFRNFLKNYWFNSFHTWHLPLWGGSLDPYSLSCS